MGEFDLLMTKLDSENKTLYFLDARILFLNALKLDKNNIEARVGLGKWWALDVIENYSREYNHSFSQVEKYLSDKVIAQLLKKTKGDGDQST